MKALLRNPLTVLFIRTFCLAFATTACETPAERAQAREQETTCTVVKLELDQPGADSICVYECVYHKGTTIGLATATPIPCGWYGKKVIRN